MGMLQQRWSKAAFDEEDPEAACQEAVAKRMVAEIVCGVEQIEDRGIVVGGAAPEIRCGCKGAVAEVQLRAR